MQNFDHLGEFLLAVLLFQLTPGPGTLTILRATADHGVRAGFGAVAGTLLGGVVCMLAAASGLEAMVQGQPAAVHALKVAGAFYLAWTGLRMIGSRPAVAARAAETPTAARQVRQALVVSLTNPKVILFYFALLPLFFRAPLTSASLAAMVGCVTGTSLLYQTGLVFAGNTIARRLTNLPSARSVVQQVAGLFFVGFAVKLFVL